MSGNGEANMTALYPGGHQVQVYHASANPHGGPPLLHDATPPPPALPRVPSPDFGHGTPAGAGDILPDAPRGRLAGLRARLGL